MSLERWLIPLGGAAAVLGTLGALLGQRHGNWGCLALAGCCMSLGGLGLCLARGYRQTRQSLESALQFQQQLLDRIPIPAFFKDKHGVYLGCNRSYEQFMGLERGRIVGRTVFDIAPPELARVYQEQDACLLARSGVQVYECEVLSKASQTRRQVVFHKATFTDSAGQVAGIIGGIIDLTDRKEAEKQREHVIAELRQALDNVKLLSGLIPICAGCKKIRDDKGYWNQIEAYIHARSEARFTHGICPECARKLYPELCGTPPESAALAGSEPEEMVPSDHGSRARS